VFEQIHPAKAARECSTTVTTDEVADSRLALAREMFRVAGVEDVVRRAQADDRVDALVVPIGTGELVCRWKGAGPGFRE